MEDSINVISWFRADLECCRGGEMWEKWNTESGYN